MKDFKFPTPIRKKMWALSAQECVYLDMTLVLPMPNSDIYKMTIGHHLTDTQCKARASALVTSMDGKDYLEARKTQLSEWFFPEKYGVSKQKSADGFSEGFAQQVIETIEREVGNPSSPIYIDAIKLAFKKVEKDLSTTNSVDPPKRYLPVSCSECAYNQWINANCEILCGRCKYREFGVANGLNLTYQEMIKPKEKDVYDEGSKENSYKE